MRGVNRVFILGNLGSDPETKSMPSGTQIANFSVATSESWKDKQTGEKQERTEWHRICFFGRLAEVATQYLRKGSKVYIEGSLRTRKWTDKQGQDRYMTEIIGSELQMLEQRVRTMFGFSNWEEGVDEDAAKTIKGVEEMLDHIENWRMVIHAVEKAENSQGSATGDK